MIAKLERTQSNVQQNTEQTQNPTTRATNKNELATKEPPPCLRQPLVVPRQAHPKKSMRHKHTFLHFYNIVVFQS